jgi:hypothetical protein
MLISLYHDTRNWMSRRHAFECLYRSASHGFRAYSRDKHQIRDTLTFQLEYVANVALEEVSDAAGAPPVGETTDKAEPSGQIAGT